MEIISKKELVKAAISAREFAYAPYSHFTVGAALLTNAGKIYTGCNIESASYTPSNCAERTAFFKAVSEGERDFSEIVIAGGHENENIHEFCPPCGVCRQVMMEFCNPDAFKIILADSENTWKIYTLEQFMPFGFGPENLRQRAALLPHDIA